MDEADEMALETEAPKCCSNKIPLKPIEGFSQVKLKKECLVLSRLEGEGVYEFLGDYDVR